MKIGDTVIYASMQRWRNYAGKMTVCFIEGGVVVVEHAPTAIRVPQRTRVSVSELVVF